MQSSNKHPIFVILSQVIRGNSLIDKTMRERLFSYARIKLHYTLI